MSAVRKRFARRAVKSTARHSAHGAVSKLRRSPLRATTLLGIGCMVGVLAGWLAGRTAAPPTPSSTS